MRIGPIPDVYGNGTAFCFDVWMGICSRMDGDKRASDVVAAGGNTATGGVMGMTTTDLKGVVDYRQELEWKNGCMPKPMVVMPVGVADSIRI